MRHHPIYRWMLYCQLLLGPWACLGRSELQPIPAMDESTDPFDTSTESMIFPVYQRPIRTLPFQILLNKVAAVAQVDPEDQALATLRSDRLELGDYDFANNVPGTQHWTAQRMFVWVRNLKVLCQDPTFQAKYPKFPQTLDGFFSAAYGRLPSPQEIQDIQSILQNQPPVEDSAFTLACLSIFSSTEFLSR